MISMRMLNRKLVRELSQSKGMLLAITSIMAAGVACYVAMQSAYHNMKNAKERYYAQCRMADFWIDLKKAPVAKLRPIGELPGVVAIEPRIQFFATADLPDTLEPINSLVISLPQQRTAATINDIVVRQGSYFTDRRDNEVIVNAAFARAHRLQPGDYVHLLLNNRRQELFVVGTAISSEFAYLLGPGAVLPDPEHFGVFYLKRRYAEDVFDMQGAANQVIGRLAPPQSDHPEDSLRRMEEILEPFGVFSTIPLSKQTSNQFLSSEIQQLSMFATIMPAIFLSVAALVLNVLMLRLVRQQRVVVGTLKALGVSDAAVFWHYVKFGLCVGLVGGVIGCVFGWWISTGYTAIYRQFYEFPDLYSALYVEILFIGVGVSMLCAAVGSGYSAGQMLRLRPAEAMRPEPPKKGGRIFLEGVGLLWNSLSTAWRNVLRTVIRQRLRTGAAIFAAAMGTAILSTGFLSQQAIRFLIDFQFQRVNRFDLELTFKNEQGDDALDEVRHLPGVVRAEPVLNVGCTFVSGPYQRKGGVTGLSPSARLTVPRDQEGNALRLPEAGLLMDRRLAALLHVEVGDLVTMIPVQGERRAVELPIARITDSFLGMSVYADIRYLSRQLGESLILSGVQLKLDGSQKSRDQLYRDLKELPAIEATARRQQLVQHMQDTILNMQWVMIGFITLFAGVIFLGSIVTSSLVSLGERQREVATLIAMGYTPWQVGNVFLRESLITTVSGTLLGMPLGFGLISLVAAQFNNDVMRFPVVSAPWVWFVVFGISIVFAIVAHALVQWRILTTDVLEGLKVKE